LNGSVVSPEQVVIVDGAVESTLINKAEGTSLNGEPLEVQARRVLKSGDLLSIGTYLIKITVGGEPPAQRRYELVIVNGASSASSPAAEQPIEPASLQQSQPVLQTEASRPPRRGPAETRTTPAKSFAAILDSLRTDEDRFYFVVEGGPQSGVRVPIESQEMLVGWDDTGEQLTFGSSLIVELCGIVRKDWSGVVLETQTPPTVSVNGSTVEGTRRLRDGDHLLFSRPGPGEKPLRVVLVFREPASLVILDSVIPRSVPADESSAQPAATDSSQPGTTAPPTIRPLDKIAMLLRSDREYFGAFTFLELTLMVIGTLVGAVIIFLILNYS
jgi:hypothetical protein